MSAYDSEELPLKPYQVPRFTGSSTPRELEAEAKTTPPHVLFFDKKFERAREHQIFMEETKIWQALLEDCSDRSGVNAAADCKLLFEIVNERMKYYNSNYNPNVRPTLTPGIPAIYEKIVE